MSTIRIAVETVTGSIYSSESQEVSDAQLEEFSELIEDVKGLSKLRLQQEDGAAVYLQPSHIVAITVTKEN